jgi:hypothetical protein
MKDQDETEAERDEDEDETEDRDSDEVEGAREPEPKRKESSPQQRGGSVAPAKSSGISSAQVGLIAVLALATGGTVGWFGHIAQAKAALRADSTAPTTESGSCGSWAQKICGSSGKESAACAQAKGAAELMTPLTCEAGLLAMPATLSKLKVMRSTCDKLVTKLCADLPPNSQTCTMVKERTPAFPAQRCEDMMQHYDEVIGQLRQMDQQQAAMHPGGPGPVVVSPQ